MFRVAAPLVVQSLSTKTLQYTGLRGNVVGPREYELDKGESSGKIGIPLPYLPLPHTHTHTHEHKLANWFAQLARRNTEAKRKLASPRVRLLRWRKDDARKEGARVRGRG